MKFKCLGLLVLIFIITGCNIDYELLITSDKKYHEKIGFTINRNAYEGDENEVRKVLEEEIEKYELFPEYQGYDYSYNIDSREITILIEKEHETFLEYKSSPFYQQIYEGFFVVEDEYYDIETYGAIHDINRGIANTSPFFVNNLIVNIKSHNNVVSSNAHKENNGSNIYTWKFDHNRATDSIKLTLDYSKRYDIIILDFLMANLLIIIMTLILLVGALVTGFLYLRNYHLRNRI